MVRVSRAWIKRNVTEIRGMNIDDIDKIKIWPEGWQTSLTGSQKKAIEKREWRGTFDLIFDMTEKPFKAVVRRA